MIRFVNITEEEFLDSKLLYKHMPLENALRTLKNKRLWFANPATWVDPFEKRFLEAKGNFYKLTKLIGGLLMGTTETKKDTNLTNCAMETLLVVGNLGVS